MPTTQMHWKVPRDAAPTTFLPLDRRLCGIYTLHFANGERYVGQTVGLANRLASHLRRWDDITALDLVVDDQEQQERFDGVLPAYPDDARTMALGLMRCGPSNFAKFHCDALLDRVLVQMSADAS